MSVLIRKARKTDALQVVEFWNRNFDAGHMKYTGSNWRRGRSDLKQFRERYADDKRGAFTFLAIDEATGNIIGVCGARSTERGRLSHRVDLGWWVDRGHGGSGVGTKLLRRALLEAKRRGFKKAEAEAAAINAPSVRLAKRCGFKIEGKLKAGMMLDSGRYVDTYMFGKMLR